MFPNVAYRATVYRTGDEIEGSFLNKHLIQYCPLSQWTGRWHDLGLAHMLSAFPNCAELKSSQNIFFSYFFIESYSCDKISMTWFPISCQNWSSLDHDLMASIWEKAISILPGNLNSGRSYLIIAVQNLKS